jgi:hypothetical protein
VEIKNAKQDQRRKCQDDGNLPVSQVIAQSIQPIRHEDLPTNGRLIWQSGYKPYLPAIEHDHSVSSGLIDPTFASQFVVLHEQIPFEPVPPHLTKNAGLAPDANESKPRETPFDHAVERVPDERVVWSAVH